ncbi:MAG: KpsF/GutQ family sugar-phosphate isomerase [Verrucomicrobia bacterium]|jgi:arabinose-5-phosphate isomerase|nr:MAG: KpsF/GutQ family sugar-phosphate isomerase [Verrucomicrobiota bacterium]
METLERARRVLSIEIDELHRLSARLDSSFALAVGMLREAVERRGKIVVLGVGKSGHIGEKIAASLTSTGAPAVVLNSLNALHGDLGVISDGDVILTLSYSGETEELIRILPSLARFDIRKISLTGNPNSSLAKASDLVLDVSVSQEACPHNLAPTSSTTVMLALGDALAMVLLEERGFTKEDFARFHPAGQLGRTLLLKVSDIMRGGDQIALVKGSDSVISVLKELTSKHAGAALVVDEQGLLEGIFTHGDFARHFSSDPQIGNQPVSGVMTRNPITIHADKLAAEVLKVLEQHHIDDLVVTDEGGKPLGVIDSQDLSRLKLL